MSRRPPPMEADDPRHGTANGYANRYCRCDDCRAAWLIYQKPFGLAWRRRRGMQPKKYGRTHGIRATYRNGCRCDDCTRAEREYSRSYRARKREMVR